MEPLRQPEPAVRRAKIHFTEMLIDANPIDPVDHHNWAFYPGMGYGSMDKWWGDYGTRDFPHEGIDICLYETPAARCAGSMRKPASRLWPTGWSGPSLKTIWPRP